ncbi:MAG: holo-ACP synthase [Phycisphaerales bacterium]|nr:holo-ACP synthase [Phycisphaerales bacterium]
MAIKGHGVDIVEISRIAEMLQSHGERFIAKCFTPGEAAYCGQGPTRAERFAARFAAKEATLKALGTGWRDGIAWTDIEVVPEPSGRPTLRVTGEAARIAGGLGIATWHISLSHSKLHAIASVIADGDSTA